VQSAPSDAEFREPFFPDMRPSTYQQQATALAQSACSRRGGLACADCHDPHGGPDPIDGPSGVSGICAHCHGSIAADAAAHAGHAAVGPGTRCEDCHMAPVLRGPASRPAVDHSLATPVARPGEVPLACAVCHDRVEDREAVAARVSAAPRSDEGTRRLAIEEAVVAAIERRTDAAERLARLASDSRESWIIRWMALRRIADLPPGPGAQTVREAALAAAEAPHPALRRVGLLVLGRWGNEADARAIAPRVESAPLRDAVAAANALVEMGVPDSGGRLTSLLRRPEAAADYRAQAAFGSLALRARDWERAERALSRSLELHPIQVPALNDLGIALWELGRFDDARAAWRRALEWNPGYEAARRNLREATP
jgi:predicted CXXCH cytochrome family protein